MSKPINKTAIGAFVLVFAALFFAGLIFFGSISFNKNAAQYVIYMDDSVNGLDIGSAVKFKGVTVGSVKSINMHLEGQRGDDLSIPIIIEINTTPDGGNTKVASEEELTTFIRKGLRARIQLTSIVTGLLYIDLDFAPNTPIILRGNKKIIDLPEIPTIPSNTTQMMKAVTTILQDLSTSDFSALSAQVKQTVERIENSLAEIEFKKINHNVVRLTDSAATILEDPELKKAIANINRLISDIDTLSSTISDQVNPLAQETKASLADLRTTLSEINEAIIVFRTTFTARQGSIGQEFGNALVQINDAARAVRALADYLHVGLSSAAQEEQSHNKNN